MNTSHYPSLELCKKLTEAGFPETEMLIWKYNGNIKIGAGAETNDNFFCPSVMELLDEMPRDIHVGPHQYTWSITPYGFTYSPNQSHSTKTIPFFSTDINSNISIDPNALAEMWLWLKENGYLSIK